eukprot:1151432-Pelagomonas_calceolata.AAC.5
MHMMQVKEEGWYLIAGDASTHELLALKRVGLEDKTTIKLSLPRWLLVAACLLVWMRIKPATGDLALVLSSVQSIGGPVLLSVRSLGGRG